MSNGKIDTADRGPLGDGEKRVIKQEHRNRALDGNLPGDDDAARLRSVATDMNMKRPRRVDDTTLRSPQAAVGTTTRTPRHVTWPARHVKD
jgi:hypothetical protein